jgi:hypothetical protein
MSYRQGGGADKVRQGVKSNRKTIIMSTFKKLSSLDVRSKVERKGSQDYLSWSNAWGMLKSEYPSANRTIYEDPHTGLNFFTDGRTAYVKVGVTVEGLEHIDYLPVMDFRNNSIPVDKVTSFDVNKTIQRATAKAIAMHGLGLTLWSGEDVPELTAQPKTKDTGFTLDIGDGNWTKVLGYMGQQHQNGVAFEDILKELGKKYKIAPKVKTELKKQLK